VKFCALYKQSVAIKFGRSLVTYVWVKSNRDQAPPGQPSGNLTFEKIIGQMPARTGRNHSQMPCYRGSPGSLNFG
jgi:hypothetical protein